MLFTIILIVVSLIGCQNIQQIEKESRVYSQTEKELVEKLKYEMLKKNSITDYYISEIVFYDTEVAFTVYLYIDEEGELHEGIAYMSISGGEWKVAEYDIARVDKKVPFTNHSLAVSTTENVEESFFITSYYINNKEITDIVINYNDQSQQVIKIENDQDLYISYQVGSEIYVKEIIGLNEKGDKIHNY